MRSILFVDDEIAVLRGLELALRRERARWRLVFALGAAEALRELAAAPFDVIVTDLQMPGMDGVALLARVRDDHPGLKRVVLSGNAESSVVARASEVAHVVLGKPCPIAELRACIGA